MQYDEGLSVHQNMDCTMNGKLKDIVEFVRSSRDEEMFPI